MILKEIWSFMPFGETKRFYNQSDIYNTFELNSKDGGVSSKLEEKLHQMISDLAAIQKESKKKTNNDDLKR